MMELLVTLPLAVLVQVLVQVLVLVLTTVVEMADRKVTWTIRTMMLWTALAMLTSADSTTVSRMLPALSACQPCAC